MESTSINTTSMISGDFFCKDGVRESIHATDAMGTVRLEGFMRYKSTINTSVRVVDQATYPSSIPVEVIVPSDLFSDEPTSVFVHLHGRLRPLTTEESMEYFNINGEDDEELRVKALIEVVIAYRYHVTDEPNTLFVDPIVALIAKVTSEARPNYHTPGSRAFDADTSTYAMGQKIGIKVKLILKRPLDTWYPRKHSVIYALAKFTTHQESTPVLQVLYVNVLSTELAPTSVSAPEPPLSAGPHRLLNYVSPANSPSQTGYYDNVIQNNKVETSTRAALANATYHEPAASNQVRATIHRQGGGKTSGKGKDRVKLENTEEDTKEGIKVSDRTFDVPTPGDGRVNITINVTF